MRILKKRKIGSMVGYACLTMFAVSCGQYRLPDHATAVLTPDELRVAVDFVATKIADAHPDTLHGTSNETSTAFASLRSRADEDMATEQIMLELNQVLATVKDGHTEIRLHDHLAQSYDYLDLDLVWNSRGLFVVNDSSSLRRGDRLRSIGGKSERELLAQLEKIVPAENDFYLRHRGAALLTRGDHLRWLGLVGADGTVEIKATRDNDAVYTADVALGVAPSADLAQNWVRYELFPQQALAVFRFDKFVYDDEMITTMQDFANAAQDPVYRKIAVDIRGNPGGDATVAYALLLQLGAVVKRSFSADVRISVELTENNPVFARETMSAVFVELGLLSIPEDATHYEIPGDFVNASMRDRVHESANSAALKGKQFFLITDGGTFSSGTLFAQLVRDNNLGSIVGQPTGNNADFNGMEMRFDVPGTDYYLNMPSGALLRPDRRRGNEDAIYPDIPILDTAESIRDGVDPQIDYLRQRITDENSEKPLPPLHARLDDFLSGLIESENGHAPKSVSLRIEVPRLDFTYSGSAGTRRAESAKAMQSESTFYVASIAKTMVATLALQLMEDGLFSLDTSIGELDVFEQPVLDRLHQVDGRSYGAEMTIRQLLTHRSGLRDYLIDDRNGIAAEHASGSAPGSLAGIWQSQLPKFLSCIDALRKCNTDENASLYPGRTWKAWDAAAFASDPDDRDAGMLNFYLAEMSENALFEPGTDVHYSDTNFMLMGVIIQELTGETLQQQLAARVFGPLGMQDSYMAYSPQGLMTASQAPPSDFYLGRLPVISKGLDISWDWGGGGVVSSAPDLMLFVRALLEGRLFRHSESLESMLDFQAVVVSDGAVTAGYGLGFRTRQTEYGPMWGHSGAWGSEMEYFPELGIFITGTVNTYGDSALKKQLVMQPIQLLQDVFLH